MTGSISAVSTASRLRRERRRQRPESVMASDMGEGEEDVVEGGGMGGEGGDGAALGIELVQQRAFGGRAAVRGPAEPALAERPGALAEPLRQRRVGPLAGRREV